MLILTDLSIIIPAWNEERVIARTLTRYVEFFSGKYDFEVIVVMDGCTDGTQGIVRKFSRKNPVVISLHFPNRLGKGGGVMRGFKAAKGDLIAFTDADGATSPEEMARLIESVGELDGVIGSRWLDGAVILKGESLGRRIASRGFNLLIRSMFFMPYSDTQCGAKVFKKDVIDNVIDEVCINNFAFDVDLLFKIMGKGYSIKEIPIEWSHDENTSLNMTKIMPKMFISLLGLRMKATPFWRLVPKWFEVKVYRMMKND